VVNDRFDQMARSLKNIEQFLAQQQGLQSVGGDTIYKGQGPSAQSGILNPSSYAVYETDDLDSVSQGGTVTLSPGESKALVRAEPNTDDGLAVMAVGANDESDVRYKLKVDEKRVVGGETNSPLGLLNDPYSFVEKFGAVVPVERRIEYIATRPASASGSVDLAGRMHVEHL
jgi:hypothetical protein